MLATTIQSKNLLTIQNVYTKHTILFAKFKKAKNNTLMDNFFNSLMVPDFKFHERKKIFSFIQHGNSIHQNNSKTVYVHNDNIVIKHIQLNHNKTNVLYDILTGMYTVEMNKYDLIPEVYNVLYDIETHSILLQMEKYDSDLFDFLLSNNYNVDQDTNQIFQQILSLFDQLATLHFLYFDSKLSNLVINIQTKTVRLIDLDAEFCFLDKWFFTHEDRSTVHYIYKIIQKHSMNKKRIYYITMISLFCLFNNRMITKFPKLRTLMNLLQSHLDFEFMQEKTYHPENIILIEEIINKSNTINMLRTTYLCSKS